MRRRWFCAAVVALVFGGCGEDPEPPPDFARVPGGELRMGSNGDEIERAVASFGVDGDEEVPSYRRYFRWEWPPHDVEVDSFYMAARPVTVRQWRRFVAATGYVTTAERRDPPGFYYTRRDGWGRRAPVSWRHPAPDWETRDNEPVVQVSLEDAEAYAEWLSDRSPGTYRLPTEAEFEWAAWGNPRWASSKDRPMFAWGNDRKVWRRANYADRRYPAPWRDQAHDDGFKYASPVGAFPPNGYGLYDIAGNVWQWTSTRMSEYPVGKLSRSYSMRGCAFTARRPWCRPQARMSHPPKDAAYDVGFRLLWEP